MRRLEPWHTNTGKRVTKSPKVFVRDSGLLHALLEIEDMFQLLGHPSVGASFESFAVECLIDAADTSLRPHHYRTARGDELDLLLVRGGQPTIGVEIKRSPSATLSAGFSRAADDLGVSERYLVHGDPSVPPYRTGNGVDVVSLPALVAALRARERPRGDVSGVVRGGREQ